MELIYYPATSVSNYNPTQCNIPEEPRRLDTVILNVGWKRNDPHDEKHSVDEFDDDDEDEEEAYCV
jgi:hypothetical protein